MTTATFTIIVAVTISTALSTSRRVNQEWLFHERLKRATPGFLFRVPDSTNCHWVRVLADLQVLRPNYGSFAKATIDCTT